MPVDKRYQVFVSSTFADLKDERQEVIQALLEQDCIPSGMELFPAANDDQWSLIKRVIDDSDYYLVIVAGRYGSIGPDGLSYTEMEYRYAMEKGKPIIAFLHEDPSKISFDKSERDSEARQKLQAFRDLCRQKMCKSWSSATDLGGKISRSLIKLIKTAPAIGWVRADTALDESAALTINKLRAENDALNLKLNQLRLEPPKGSEILAQGQDTVTIELRVKTGPMLEFQEPKISMTWDQIFGIVAPCMIREASEYVVRNVLAEASAKRVGGSYDYIGETTVELDSSSFHKVMVQLRALGLITESTERRSVKDRGTTYWSLTPFGDAYMNRLLAIPRKS